jgi:hypothetical protein
MIGLTRIVGRLGHIAATGRIIRCAAVIEVSQIEKISDDADARWMEFSEGTPHQIFDSGQILQA